jgi:membrane protein
VLKASLQAWSDHRAASKGAALAFYTLFSMAPILLVAIAVAGYFFGDKAAEGRIVYELQDLVGPNGAQVVAALLASANDRSKGLVATLVAAALLALGASSVFVELKGSLDELWHDDKRALQPPKAAWRVLLKTRLVAFGLVLVLALLLLVSLVVSAALSMLHDHLPLYMEGSALVLQIVSSTISLVVIACLFAVIYKMLPDAPLSWSDVGVGSIVTALLFTAGKYAIGYYLARSGAASGFGAAGSLVALLLWIYYSAQIFFFGAEFTRHFALHFGSLRKEWRARAARPAARYV